MMLRLLNLRVLLVCALLTSSIFINDIFSQVTEVKYQHRYNSEDCLWDFFIIIQQGNATSVGERAQFNAQYTIVVPTGTVVPTPIPNLPIQNNQNYTGTEPAEWNLGAAAINPSSFPGFDFWPIIPKINPASFFNNLVEEDTVKIFSIDLGIVPGCGSDVRLFDNATDPPPGSAGFGGGAFQNGYTLGGTDQDYSGNIAGVYPEVPVLSAFNPCTSNIELDLTATTSACQEPLMYSWSGPNGFTSTDEDVLIENPTAANIGDYTVTVTDAFGCTSEATFAGETKPDAGEDLAGCPGESVDLLGDPTSGSWAADPDNAAGATLTSGAAGAATVDFDASAAGSFGFIYTDVVCTDSVLVAIIEPDAGDDPSPISCFSQGTATLNASSAAPGLWTIGAGSAGTADISDPTNPNTTVTNFSSEGSYFLVWDIGACSDMVTLVANGNCDCVITNNSIAPISPNTFCGTSGNILIDGGTVPEQGSYLWEYGLNAGTFSSAPGTNTTEDYTTEDLGIGVHSFRRIFTTNTGIICSDTSNMVSLEVIEEPGVPENIQAEPQEICENETTNLFVANNPLATYTWTATPAGSGLVMDGSNAATLVPTLPGVYTVSVIQTVDGCPSLPATIDVTVNEVPTTPDPADFGSGNPTICEAADGFISIAGFLPNTSYTVNYTFNGASTSVNVTSNGSGAILIDNLVAGSYADFEIVNDSDCSSGVVPNPISLSDPDAPDNPTGLMGTPNPECLGQPITLSVDDVIGATFNWSASSPNAGLGSSTTNTIVMNPTAAGTFNVFVSLTIAGCTSIDTFTTILVNEAPPTPSAATVSGSNPSACGGADGFITLSGYDPTTLFDLTYSLNGTPTTIPLTSNGSGVLSINGLTEGTYSDFRVTNFTGCSSGIFPGPISLADPGSPDAPANLTANPNPVCLGNVVSLSADNISGATFNWSANSPDAGLGSTTGNTITMNPTAAGTYTISVSVSVAGCTSMSSSIDVVVGGTPPTPSNIIGNDPTECAGADGSIVLPGYNPGETFTLNYSTGGSALTASLTADASGNLILSGLISGSYSDFSISNAAGCPSASFAGPINLVDPTAPDAPTGLAAMPNPLCQGETTTISATNTTGAIYTWSVSPADSGFTPNSTNEITFTPSADGIFVVSVIQTIDGCTSASSAPLNVIVSPSPDTPDAANITSMNPSGCADSDGSISISGYDASTTYSIEFDSAMVSVVRVITADGSGTVTLTGLPSGSYSNFTFTNELGCSSGSFPGPVSLSDPGAPDAPADLTANPDPSCLGTEVMLSVTNNPGAVYTWTVSGANSATAGLVTSTTNTTTVMPMVAGTYTISVSQDLAGCISPAAMIDITVSDVPPTPTVVGTDPSDCGVANGLLTLSGLDAMSSYILTYSTNGTPSTSTVTSNGAGEIVIMGLSSGIFADFGLSNATGCDSGIFPGPITLVEPAAPSAPTAVGTDPSDCGMANGSILISGFSPNTENVLTYSFNGSETTATFTSNASGDINLTGLASGDYTNFSFVNTSGCTSGVFAGPVTLSEPNAPDAPTGLMADPNPICLGGTINLSVDAVANATYNWSSSSPDAGLVTSTTNNTSMTPTAAGTYTVSVSLTIAGCQSAPISIDVTVDPNPDTPTQANITATDPTSCTTDDGEITISGYIPGAVYSLVYSFNGNLPVSIMVTANASGELIISNLSAGTYTSFQLTDSNGCTSGPFVGTIELVQPGAPIPPSNLQGSPNPVCLGNTVNLSVDNNPAATYEWSVSDINGNISMGNGSTATLNPSTAGTFTVSVIQTITGCTSSPATIQIFVLENCLNPDFGVTFNDVELTGDLSTNDDINPGTTYGNPVAIGANPTPALPIVNSDGTYTFNTTTFGEWYFLVDVCTSSTECSAVPLAITVLDVESTENPPIGNHDYVATTTNNNVVINVLANDKCQSFPNCDLTVTDIVTGPFFGMYDIGTQTYIPNNGFAGVDSFLYEVCQNPTTPQSCDQEWVYIDVYPDFADQFTSAMDDYNQTTLNTPINASVGDAVLNNDTDPNDVTLTITPQITTISGQGTLELNADGTYVFTPENNYIGPVDFPYTVCRSNDNTICDNATLHILVEPMPAAGSIGSCVWEDINGNGILETGEPSVSNVVVNLFDELGQFVATTSTDATGNYQFDDVLQGIYFLEFIADERFEFTVPNIGNDTNDSDVDESNGPGTTALLSLSSGQFIDNVKAGLFECVRIGDNVWYDVNMNDIYDETENGINGLIVQLWRNVNGQAILWDETTTGHRPNTPSDDGFFEFCTSPGNYYVEFILPAGGLVQALPFAGNDSNRDSDVNNANGPGTTSSFTVLNGQSKLDLGSGYYPEAIAGNLVWFDENFDGTQNPDEERIAGVLVEVFDANTQEFISSTVTDDNGIYKVDSLSKNDIYFKFTPPEGMVATISDAGTDVIDSDVDHSYGWNTTRAFSMQPSTTNNHIDFGFAAGALPVEWRSINVYEKDESHLVEWIVEQEVNVDEYQVLRRHESDDEFRQVGSSIRANDVLSVSEYNYIDSDIDRPGYYYYKVRQVDYDGKVNFSKITSIEREVRFETRLYPNPTTNNSKLEFEALTVGELNVSIFDLTGKLIKSLAYQVEEGFGNVNIDFQNIAPGAYNVTINLNGKIDNKRLIILK